jgi:hypothetical protein
MWIIVLVIAEAPILFLAWFILKQLERRTS